MPGGLGIVMGTAQGAVGGVVGGVMLTLTSLVVLWIACDMWRNRGTHK